MKILVTGASGFIGLSLCKHLNALDCELVPSVRRPTGIPNEIILSKDEEWIFALNGCNVVIHLAGRAHVIKGETGDSLLQYRLVNVQGTEDLAKQAVKAGVQRFVYISSIKVNGERTAQNHAFIPGDIPNPEDAYGQSKLEAEEGLRQISAETGMEVVIIRPPLVYGPGVKANFAALMRAVQKGYPLPLGAVHNQRSLIALDNLVDFIITCISHPLAANQTFVVSDGQDLSTTELLKGMAKAADVPSRLLPVPVWALQAAASVLGKGDVIQRLCGNLQVDISKARTLLGWVPPISVEEGLRRAMQPIQ